MDKEGRALVNLNIKGGHALNVGHRLGGSGLSKRLLGLHPRVLRVSRTKLCLLLFSFLIPDWWLVL